MFISRFMEMRRKRGIAAEGVFPLLLRERVKKLPLLAGQIF